MIINIIENKGRRIIAVCDKGILGKKFEEDDKQLDLTSDFYDGKEESEEKIKDLIKNFWCMNVVGEKSVSFIIKELDLNQDSIKKIDGIPYLQVFNV